MDFYFAPTAGTLAGDTLRVSPDLLPAGRVRIGQVWINGHEHRDFDAENLTVKLPTTGGRLKVRVRLAPAGVHFSADLLEITNNTATIALAGALDADALSTLKDRIDYARSRGAQAIVFDAEDLDSISDEALRMLAFTKQKLGADFDIAIEGASPEVTAMIEESGFGDEIEVVELATA
jgi:anti-anti-sigma factor